MAGLSLSELYSRAVRLRCPRCGQGRLFAGWFRMHPTCSNCNLRYERAPGYFLGSTYINYALTAATLTVLYVVFHFKAGYGNRTLMAPLLAYCVLFPLICFRHSRAFWLAMDCYWDTTDFALEQQSDPEAASDDHTREAD